MKINRTGQAAILTKEEFNRIGKALLSNKGHNANPKRDWILLKIVELTGERIGACLQLEADMVYLPDGRVREKIVFAARTRKASPSGVRRTREVVVSNELRECLESYGRPEGKWMFPSRSGGHISKSRADHLWRDAIRRSNLGHKGATWHSGRRTLITNLAAKGIHAAVIQRITGHQSLQVLNRYIEISEAQVANALNCI